jgi:hypothetical protein
MLAPLQPGLRLVVIHTTQVEGLTIELYAIEPTA